MLSSEAADIQRTLFLRRKVLTKLVSEGAVSGTCLNIDTIPDFPGYIFYKVKITICGAFLQRKGDLSTAIKDS